MAPFEVEECEHTGVVVAWKDPALAVLFGLVELLKNSPAVFM
jgi:hypothetical protein